MRIVSGGSTVIRGTVPSESFSVGLVDSPVEIGTGADEAATVKDLSYTTRTTGGTVLKSDIVLEVPLSSEQVFTYSSNTPNICDVDATTGAITVNASGKCEILVQGSNGTRLSSQDVRTGGSGMTLYTAVTSTAVGSLRKHLYDQQVAALDGVTPGAAAQRAHINGVATGGSFGAVNPNNFLRTSRGVYIAPPLDALDEILASTAQGGIEWRAWITPHHYLTWLGHGATNGSTWVALPPGEIVIAYSAVAWNGTICKLLPKQWRDYLPDTPAYSIGSRVCVWARLKRIYGTLEQTEGRWVQPVHYFLTNPFPVDDNRRQFQRAQSEGATGMANSGDSGSPVFCIINEELVPFTIVSNMSAMGAVTFSDRYDEIQAAVNTLNGHGPYTVQTVDLSAFPSYA